MNYGLCDKLLLYLVYFFPILDIELTGKSKKVNISFGELRKINNFAFD